MIWGGKNILNKKGEKIPSSYWNSKGSMKFLIEEKHVKIALIFPSYQTEMVVKDNILYNRTGSVVHMGCVFRNIQWDQGKCKEMSMILDNIAV